MSISLKLADYVYNDKTTYTKEQYNSVMPDALATMSSRTIFPISEPPKVIDVNPVYYPAYVATDRSMYKYEYEDNICYSFGEFEKKGDLLQEFVNYWYIQSLYIKDDNINASCYVKGNHKIICALSEFISDDYGYCYYPMCKAESDNTYYLYLDVDLNDDTCIEKINEIGICHCNKDDDIIFTAPYKLTISDFIIDLSLDTDIYSEYETTGYYIIDMVDNDFWMAYEAESEQNAYPIIIF